jgi:polyhydroxyalkanoate synthase
LPPALPPAAGISAVDALALSALNARYQPRFQALWAAAQAALMAEAASAPMPTIASPSPGDRRFTAAEWNELPYFALLKQYYLLSAEYMNELVALAPLPDAEKQRLRFLTRQAIDALSPTNFPQPIPKSSNARSRPKARALLEASPTSSPTRKRAASR